MKLKYSMKEFISFLEDHDIKINIDCWGGRGKKLIKIPSVGHLRYYRFEQILKLKL